MWETLAGYDVIWDSPSSDANGSMPIGNGDLAANVWIEPSGDLLILLAKSDAWDENASLLKLGRLRVQLDPMPATSQISMRLRLQEATLVIDCADVKICLWCDARRPVLCVQIDSTQPRGLLVTLENWRTEPRTLKTQTSDLFKRLGSSDPHPTTTWPDDVLEDRGGIVWCHHNRPRDPDGYAVNMRLQGLGDLLDVLPHPLLHRTFGASVWGGGLRVDSATALVSEGPQTRWIFQCAALTLHPSSIEQWTAAIRSEREAVVVADASAARDSHELWWRAFWERSWIFLDADDANRQAEARQVTRAYVFQRYMNACAGRGASPIKFNGSLFSVGKPDDPDFRRWGGPGYWFQNCRLVHWPMLASGDVDLMMPYLRMYLAQLPLHRFRTRKYFGHGGAHFPETISWWGAEVSAHYGWTPFESRVRPEAECSYVTYYWTSGIELTLLLYETWRATGDASFANEFVIPIAGDVVTFFDLHYLAGDDGKRRIAPTQALETWQWAVNATPDIAGLRYLLPKLLSMPEGFSSSDQRMRWRRLFDELPDIPMGDVEGSAAILPAEQFDQLKNKENPELYAVFPFELFTRHRAQLDLGRHTFAARRFKVSACWSQDEIQAAMLGLRHVAATGLIERSSSAHATVMRFPGFWDAHNDWQPDVDHGGVLQLALQRMLMQQDGATIHLLPAWPSEWNAWFKLHAAGGTIIEGRVVRGQLEQLRTTPEERSIDVVIDRPMD